MPKIFHVANPYQPLEGLDHSLIVGGTSIREYLASKFPGFTEFPDPTICVVNEVPWLRERWDEPLQETDLVVFMPAVGYSVVVAIVVAVVVAVAVVLIMDTAVPNNDGLPQPDPVYSLKGQSNQNRKGEPVERHYGHIRHWPSLGARPYNQYNGDDQYLYLLLVVGAGKYFIDEFLVDDTPVEDLSDVEYEILEPGERVTLFPTFVETSVEVANIEFLGPNESGYDWSGWYVITTAGEKTYKIGIDVSFRQGCYYAQSDGDIDEARVEAIWQYQKIDSAGNPVGSIMTLMDYDKTYSTTRAIRKTYTFSVSPARYRVRAKRLTDFDEDEESTIQDRLTWDAVRAYNKTNQDFGNVTMIAVKARATNNLNDNSKNRWNVRLRSKTRVWDPTTGWDLVDTRSPVWAMVDVLRADYGKNLSSKHINLVELKELADELESDNIFFDWTFDQRGTVWPAIQAALTVGRARAILPNALISAVRDTEVETPSIGLLPHNIKRGSFRVQTKLPVFGAYDGLEVEYMNTTNWERETVVCLLDSDKGINPRQVRLSGCTSRNRAYRWGLATRAMELDQVHNIQLTTGIEGGTVRFGDLAIVQHDLLPVVSNTPGDQCGRLDPGSIAVVGSTTVFTLPALPVFEPSETHKLYVRGRTGTMHGPYTCTAHVSDPYKVVVAAVLSLGSLFNVPDSAEQPTYFFGVSGKESMKCKINKIAPGENGEVALTLVPYTERIYSFGGLTAPDLGLAPVVEEPPKFPTVSNLSVDPINKSKGAYLINWLPSFGATLYVIETSWDGTNYTFESTEALSSYVLTARAGTIWVRVAAIGSGGAGAWTVWTGAIGAPTKAPVKVKDTDIVLVEPVINGISIVWPEDETAEYYILRLYRGTGAVLLMERQVTTNRYLFTKEYLDARSAEFGFTSGRIYEVSVEAVNAIGTNGASDLATFTRGFPIPSIPTSLAHAATIGGDIYPISWLSADRDDGMVYDIYTSTTNGFTAGPGNLFRTVGTLDDYVYAPTRPFYWKVGVNDKWGGLWVSAQATIPP